MVSKCAITTIKLYVLKKVRVIITMISYCMQVRVFNVAHTKGIKIMRQTMQIETEIKLFVNVMTRKGRLRFHIV